MSGRAAVLGAGTMGSVALAALWSSGWARADALVATTRTSRSAEQLRARHPGVTVIPVSTCPTANATAVREADMVVLAVKPYQITDVLREIADQLLPNALVVCFAAGIRLATLEDQLPLTCRLARVLPNTPTHVHRGVIGVCGGRGFEAEEWALLTRVFESQGLVVPVDEAGIDLVSAVSGSGPAYFYLMAERLADAAVRQGMDAGIAADLVRQTLIGAAELAATSGSELTTLRRRVTSPGGTTERAVAALEAADLVGLFDAAVAASIARATELAEGE